jgi:hypothetical protein
MPMDCVVFHTELAVLKMKIKQSKYDPIVVVDPPMRFFANLFMVHMSYDYHKNTIQYYDFR